MAKAVFNGSATFFLDASLESAIEATTASNNQELWRGMHVHSVEFNQSPWAHVKAKIEVSVPMGFEVAAYRGDVQAPFVGRGMNFVTGPNGRIGEVGKEGDIGKQGLDGKPWPDFDELTKNLGTVQAGSFSMVRATSSVASHVQQFSRVMRNPAKKYGLWRAADSIRDAWWNVSGHLAFVSKSALGALLAWAIVAIAKEVL